MYECKSDDNKIEDEKLKYANEPVRYLNIGTVIGNAFIEVMQQTNEKAKSLNMYDIMDYADKIENLYESKCQKVVVEIDYDKLKTFMNNYRNYFSFNSRNHQIYLNDGITTENLINQFRWSLNKNLIKTFSNKKLINQCFLKKENKEVKITAYNSKTK